MLRFISSRLINHGLSNLKATRFKLTNSLKFPFFKQYSYNFYNYVKYFNFKQTNFVGDNQTDFHHKLRKYQASYKSSRLQSQVIKSYLNSIKRISQLNTKSSNGLSSLHKVNRLNKSFSTAHASQIIKLATAKSFAHDQTENSAHLKISTTPEFTVPSKSFLSKSIVQELQENIEAQVQKLVQLKVALSKLGDIGEMPLTIDAQTNEIGIIFGGLEVSKLNSLLCDFGIDIGVVEAVGHSNAVEHLDSSVSTIESKANYSPVLSSSSDSDSSRLSNMCWVSV